MKETLKEYEDSKTRILLVTGFLGSGKTTLLKKILSWEKDLSGTVVIVNEFGKVGIDGTLLQRSGSDVIELTSGCICCTMKLDLISTLKDVWERFRPRRIFLEATGVAEPAAVASVLVDGELKQRMEIQNIITVVDIRFWNARESLGSFFMNQLMQAKLILLNKADTAERHIVSKALKEIHEAIPGCRIVPTTYCEVDPDILWADDRGKTECGELFPFYSNIHPPKAKQENGYLNRDYVERKTLPSAGKEFVAFDFCDDEAFNETSFKEFLEQVSWELFRIKGPVRFPDRTLFLNFAGGSSEWQPWDDDKGTRLAFVGWGVDEVEVIKQLKKCLKPE